MTPPMLLRQADTRVCFSKDYRRVGLVNSGGYCLHGLHIAAAAWCCEELIFFGFFGHSHFCGTLCSGGGGECDRANVQ